MPVTITQSSNWHLQISCFVRSVVLIFKIKSADVCCLTQICFHLFLCRRRKCVSISLRETSTKTTPSHGGGCKHTALVSAGRQVSCCQVSRRVHSSGRDRAGLGQEHMSRQSAGHLRRSSQWNNFLGSWWEEIWPSRTLCCWAPLN